METMKSAYTIFINHHNNINSSNKYGQKITQGKNIFLPVTPTHTQQEYDRRKSECLEELLMLFCTVFIVINYRTSNIQSHGVAKL